MPEKISSLSLAVRIVLNLHALNNEGADGNTVEARQVAVVYADPSQEGKYRLVEVNAISGEMMKRGFLIKFLELAKEWKLYLSPAALRLDAERAQSMPEFQDLIKEQAEQKVLYDQLLACSLTDIAGVFLALKGSVLGRKSAVEFSLTVALPTVQKTTTLFHHRLPSQRKAASKDENSKPMPFERPVSSGIYAVTARVNPNWIGYNEISESYPEEVNGIAIDRGLRFRAVVTALAYSLLSPVGAFTSTQLPHIEILDGYFSIGKGGAPATQLTPLSGADVSNAAEVASRINAIHRYEAVKIFPFSNESELLEKTLEIIESYEPDNSKSGLNMA